MKFKQPRLPANNISQQLFYTVLPNCQGSKPEPCCTTDLELQKFYMKTPTNLWNTATNYQGGPGFSNCTEIAFFKQAMLSQYYTYVSGNNKFVN